MLLCSTSRCRNLDAKLRRAMRVEFKALQRRLDTHRDLRDPRSGGGARALSDRIVVMRDGVIEQAGTPAEIYDSPSSRFVAEFVGVSNILPCDVISPERRTDRRGIRRRAIAGADQPDSRQRLCLLPSDQRAPLAAPRSVSTGGGQC